MQPLETIKIRADAHEKPKIDMRDVNEIVHDLIKPNPFHYWLDLSLSVILGWSAFLFYILANDAFPRACFFLTAVICLYRALFFIHEISHHSTRDLPGFRFGWNLLVGIPMMVPSFLYESVHLDHHRRHKYGTSEDPEYLPLGKGTRIDILIFLSKTLLFPVGLALRALVLAPIGLLIPPFHKWLEVNLSALVINESYKRGPVSELERSRMKMTEALMLAAWVGLMGLYAQGLLPKNFFKDWYLLIFAIGFLNQIRTLVAHRYNNDLKELEYEEQLLDSVNVEGGFLTELWAPIGARYHALHHYIPKLPYHSLPEAHERMKIKFADSHVYSSVNERSFMAAFAKLWKVVVFALLLSLQLPAPVLAQSNDPCQVRIRSSLRNHENISLVKAGMHNIESLVEVESRVFSDSTNNIFGRFFEIKNKTKKLIFWMIPYAQGNACVIRDVKII